MEYISSESSQESSTSIEIGISQGTEPDDHEYLVRWLQACNQHHADACVPSPTTSKQPHQIPKRVIDIQNECLVSGGSPQVHRYVALSYTWAQAESSADSAERLMLSRQNLSKFCETVFLDPTKLPMVIREAIELLRAVGERYLWVDCICIPQGDEQTSTEVEFMDEIYLGAYFTIIAAAASGLHGARSYEITEGYFYLRGYAEECQYKLLNTPWARRGWTFQEHLLSNRAVVFLGEGEIFWDCNRCVWGPETRATELNKTVDPDPRSVFYNENSHKKAKYLGEYQDSFDLSSPDMELYTELVCLYNNRDLTFPQDALAAFSGVLHALAPRYRGGFINGLPGLLLDGTLLWQPIKGDIRRRFHLPLPDSGTPQVALPSWSWCGWKCTIDPRSFEFANTDESVLDHLKLQNGEMVAEFCHESLHDSSFLCPFPLVEHGASQSHVSPSLNWPFLSGQTSQASLRTRCILRPHWKNDKDTNPDHRYRGTVLYVSELPEYEIGSDEIFSVAMLEDERGRWAGTLRLGEEGCLKPGEYVRLIALSKGSCPFDHLDSLDEAIDFEAYTGFTYQTNYKTMTESRVIFTRESDAHCTPSLKRTASKNAGVENPLYYRERFKEKTGIDPEETYHSYNVMWVEQRGDIYYRRAVGRIKQEIWDESKSEPTSFILG